MIWLEHSIVMERNKSLFEQLVVEVVKDICVPPFRDPGITCFPGDMHRGRGYSFQRRSGSLRDAYRCMDENRGEAELCDEAWDASHGPCQAVQLGVRGCELSS